MPVDGPDTLAALFASAVTAGDVEGALGLWIEDATLISASGEVLRGREQMEPVVRALVDNGIALEAELDALYRARGVALGTGRLTMSGSDGEGRSHSSQSTSTVVYLETEDGWRIAIDAPWGLPQPAEAAAHLAGASPSQ
ncbi:MAG TPA: SgcJ/EcaC family oxidoreductase [Solirubrobacteraceae bacterium]|jgi:uncharacterized protein (TIGR02246 family)|nr:SgcJ/EcaC family oxidoreductase [Solirubrobacteraceae bacterium]